jgi:hypothetical protein
MRTRVGKPFRKPSIGNSVHRPQSDRTEHDQAVRTALSLGRRPAAEHLPHDQYHGDPVDDGWKSCGCQQLPVCLQKGLPGCLPFPARGRFNAVSTQDIADAAGRNLEAQIGHGAADSIKAPTEIFPGQADHELPGLGSERLTSESPAATTTAIRLLRNQLSMPTQDCIGSRYAGDLPQPLAAQDLNFDR